MQGRGGSGHSSLVAPCPGLERFSAFAFTDSTGPTWITQVTLPISRFFKFIMSKRPFCHLREHWQVLERSVWTYLGAIILPATLYMHWNFLASRLVIDCKISNWCSAKALAENSAVGYDYFHLYCRSQDISLLAPQTGKMYASFLFS